MVNPKVSVIVPIYNVEKYLDRCMQSLLNQTLKEIEIILVDDGSPDNCPQLCDAYAKKDLRIKVIHKQNAGLGFARNSGIDRANGEFIAFVDSDDYIETTMYENLYNEAIQSNSDAVFCGFKTETKKDIWEDSKEIEVRTEWNGNNVYEFMLDMVASAPYQKKERKYSMSVWHSIYKSSVIKNNNITFHSEREILSEDIPFQIDFLKRAKKVVYLPIIGYYYCLNNTSLTASFKAEKFSKTILLFHLLSEKLKEIPKAQERVDRFFIGYSRSHLTHLIQSNLKNKSEWLYKDLKEDIWNQLKIRYKPSFLPIYPRIFYSLIIHNYPNLLILYIHFITILKRLAKKKH